MKDRRGMLGRATGLAESVVAGARRRQQARAPKALLYGSDGRPRTLDPSAGATQGLQETAQKMVALAGPPEPAEAADPLDGDE